VQVIRIAWNQAPPLFCHVEHCRDVWLRKIIALRSRPDLSATAPALVFDKKTRGHFGRDDGKYSFPDKSGLRTGQDEIATHSATLRVNYQASQ